MRQSVSLITLGVSDYGRAKAFYEALGWSPGDGRRGDRVLPGQWRRPRPAVAPRASSRPTWASRTTARAGAASRWRTTSRTDEEVDRVIEEARPAPRSRSEPSPTFYGGDRRRASATSTASCGRSRTSGVRARRRRQRDPARALNPDGRHGSRRHRRRRGLRRASSGAYPGRGRRRRRAARGARASRRPDARPSRLRPAPASASSSGAGSSHRTSTVSSPRSSATGWVPDRSRRGRTGSSRSGPGARRRAPAGPCRQSCRRPCPVLLWSKRRGAG